MSNPLRVEMSGPLSAVAPGFLEELLRQGYRPETAAKQLQLMAHLSRWLAARELDSSDLTGAQVGQFLAERRERHRHLISAKGIGPLLGYLRGLGVAPAAGRSAPRTPSDLLIDRYSAYLLQRRGLSQSTVRNYANVAREFLADRERRQGELALDELDAASVNAFVLREARRSSVGSAKCTVTRLRSLLASCTSRARSATTSQAPCRESRAGASRRWSRPWTATASRDSSEAVIRAVAPAGATSRCSERRSAGTEG